VQADIDIAAESNRKISAATRERFIESLRDGVRRVVNDAGVALERVTKPIVRIRKEPTSPMKGGEQLVGVIT